MAYTLAQQWFCLVVVCGALITSILFPFVYPRYQSEMEFFLVANENKIIPDMRHEIHPNPINPKSMEIYHITRKTNEHKRHQSQCKPLHPNIQQIQSSFSLSLSNNTVLSKPELPSLLLIAPPKSEHHYWNQQCNLTMDKNIWKHFLILYASNKTNLSFILYNMLHINRSKSNNSCSIYQYQSELLNNRNEACWKHKQCMFPMIDNDNNSNNYCYLIEKAPFYSQHPWIPIVYANILPRVKLLTIVRNPVSHILSAAYAYKPIKDRKNMSLVMENIINELEHLTAFNNLSIECVKINNKWNTLKDKDPMERYLNMKFIYKTFIVQFMWEKYVNLHVNNSMIYGWSAFVFPTILTAFIAYDELKNNYINYKIIQFEWMYSDDKHIAGLMKSIYCWVMNINESECSPIIDTDQNIKLFEMIGKYNHVTPNINVNDYYYQYYANKIHLLFDSCNEALLNLMHDRNLMFGEWS
eukprot:482532_1